MKTSYIIKKSEIINKSISIFTMNKYVIKKVYGVISTDDILPAIYKHSSLDYSFLATKIFEYKFPELKIVKNCVLVSNSLFGIGSSREQAVQALIYAGVKIIIAKDFGRIFYRNCWNCGLPAITANLYDSTKDNQEVIIDIEKNLIKYDNTEQIFDVINPFLINLIKEGGLKNLILKLNDHERI